MWARSVDFTRSAGQFRGIHCNWIIVPLEGCPPPTGRSAGVRFHTSTGVRVPVAAGLSATTALKVDWDNDPAPGTESTDTTLLFGLGYVW